LGYYLSEPAPSDCDPTAKNRVWGFFAQSVSENLETRHAALETHQENYGGPRRTASGIPLWPSRDPIGERGGVNLYGFVGNDGVNWWDILGLNGAENLEPNKPLYSSAEEATAAGSLYALHLSRENLESRQLDFDRKPKSVQIQTSRPTHMVEYCGRVCCKNGDYYFAEATPGTSSGCPSGTAPKCLETHKQVGVYHNHPTSSYGNDHTRLSGTVNQESLYDDIGNAERNNWLMGLGYEYKGEDGLKTYDPFTNETTKWGRNSEGYFEQIP
jgi:RHS repeat-associated protein